MAGCAECGAAAGSCEALFHELLARDLSGRVPWAPLHAVSVACYSFQHPGRMGNTVPAYYWAVLHAYVRGGVDALTHLTQRTQQRNSHRYGGSGPAAGDFSDVPEFPRGVGPPGAYEVTIQDVAVDGDFPADGFEEWARRWAEATISAWNGEHVGP
ncbi:DUF5946 family protein [Nonomuraea rosea]|uniref:DUF5946 family protein n=1 Tax=Nonomuraea rosea TaxID=638574 RepID=UPI003CD09986